MNSHNLLFIVCCTASCVKVVFLKQILKVINCMHGGSKYMYIKKNHVKNSF